MASTSGFFRERVVRAMLCGLFLLSGASALTYQIVWTRQLALVAGATTPAVSTALAVFMGGLALGAWWFGRIADRSRALLRWYAALELGIALFAALQPLLLAWLRPRYLQWLPAAGGHEFGLLALRIGLAAMLLLIPTTLMGGTLPLLVRFVTRREERLGRNLGALYSFNLLGAVLGSALTGFVAIRALGVERSLAVAVAINVIVGLAAWVMSCMPSLTSALTATNVAPAPAVVASASTGGLRAWLWVVVAFSGVLTMGYEVAWTRMLVFAFGSTVYSFTLILVVFLLGLALGSLAFVRLERRGAGAGTLAWAQWLGAAGALALAPCAAHLPEWINRASARFGYTGGMQLAGTMAGCCLVMLLPAVCMGVVFPLSSRLLVEGLDSAGKRLGQAYWVNTLGAIVGALGVGFLLVPLCSIKGALLALAGAQAVLAAALLPWREGRRAWLACAGGVGLVAAAAAFFLGMLPGPNPFDRLGYNQGQPVAVDMHRDDVTASVTVVRSASGVRALRINGFEASSDADSAGYMPLMSHVPLLIHGGEAPRVLVICFGTGSTAGAALLHPGARVDAVDINASVFACAPWFETVNHRVDRDPRARLIVDDGRNYLATTRETYDVITAEPMPPTHAGVVNLYSREYYELARARLRPGGLLVQWLPFHLLTREQSQAILRTVQDVFPETTLWLHSHTGLIVARLGQPVSLDWAALTRAFSNEALATDLAKVRVFTPEAFVQLFALGPQAARAWAGDVPAITDDRPSLEFHPPRHRLSVALGAGVFTRDFAACMLEIYARGGASLPVWRGTEPPRQAGLARQQALHVMMQSGNIWMGVKQPAEAARCYEAGVQAAEGDAGRRAAFRYGLALAAVARGQTDEALQQLAQCLIDAPDYAAARQLREELKKRVAR
ncbi:MAG: fused MFS/spermidine synthase [Opitutae bacterium]|nr:fused MFS/spermidine synthase [Opitutae bacterium]